MIAKKKKNTKKIMKSTKTMESSSCIVFDSNMRKIFIEGVIQDIKGYFENKTDGLVEVMYEDFSLKGHEFSFKIYVLATDNCKKQMFSETSSAIINVVNYMFSSGNEQYDVTICASPNSLEFEIVSNW